jgi:hypothetical protein
VNAQVISPAASLRVDAARIKAEENLDGKYLLHTPASHWPRTSAPGHKQPLEAERG